MSNIGVSVIITAYDRKDFVIQAIESVINQKYDPSSYEIILVTNFNIDLTNYKVGCQLKSILMDGSIGEFLYAGVLAATYSVIAFLDDDDTFEPMKLNRLVDVFSKNSKLCYYHNDVRYVDINNKPLDYVRLVEKKTSFSHGNNTIFDAETNFGSLKNVLENRGDFNISSIAIRLECYMKYFSMLKEIKGTTDGFFFWTGLISTGQLMIDDIKLTNYRIHNTNVSGKYDFIHKAIELRRQIYTYVLILRILEQAKLVTEMDSAIKKWVLLYKYEYELMAEIFGKSPRILILRSFWKILDIGHHYSNTLKRRILLLGVIALISKNYVRIIYSLVR
jgi:glycosyltransferase involved in cell wall biosynthesis